MNEPSATITIRAEIRREYSVPGRPDEKFSIALQADASVPFQPGTEAGLTPSAVTSADLRVLLEGQVEIHIRDVKSDVATEKAKGALRKQIIHLAGEAFGLQGRPETKDTREAAEQLEAGLQAARTAYDNMPAPCIFPPFPDSPEA